MTFDMRKRRHKQRGAKPTAPIDNPNKWATLIIRSEHYSMLRELALYYDRTIGQTAMTLIADEFNKLLKEVDPKYKVEGFRPSIFPDYSRFKKRSKKRGRLPSRKIDSMLPDEPPKHLPEEYPSETPDPDVS